MFIIKDTIKTSDELASKLDVPVLASIHQVENKSQSKGLLVTDKRTGFSFIETYKVIRTKIENNSAKTGNKVYLVTSACENEGKTTVAVNIALSLAQKNREKHGLPRNQQWQDIIEHLSPLAFNEDSLYLAAETAKEIIKLGMYIGFTGVLTFKNAKKALKALEEVPLERLLLETDCPYMAPVPFRGKRCDSSMIAYTAEKAAEIKGTDVQKLLDITCKNAMEFYSIK